ncbi:swi5-like zinc finger protein [Coemansia sp. RSA 989]|nr:swi5-like zinc finger protein [Coemansia sp. RSA 989]KAJ1871423.1 swi5-like zinc finger protein [Coemansia sp. RSA 990]KAJ2668700.1 swi5-like zinc finger protein [Coemansia sp. RSA 1085]
MEASPTRKRKPAVDLCSLIPESTDSPLSLLIEERKQELQAAISTLKSDIEEQSKKRDTLLEESCLTVEEARQLNDQHIDRLHRYNSVKDAAQKLFGKLAELKGKTVKEIYEEYQVDLND